MRYEIRWHGRGGQGAVTAAMILAKAAIYEGKYAQAFPEFGAERRGAPVRAYSKVSDKPIYSRSPILNPDAVVVLDSSLPKELYLEGLKEGGLLIVNTKKSPEELREALGIDGRYKIYTVDATKIALEVLGVPIVNTAMVGAFVKALPIVSLESVARAIQETFPGRVGEKNVEAAQAAYEALVEASG